MDSSFDKAAANYDSTFTNSAIGKTQRSFVRKHLSKLLKNYHTKTILEINCGTGEDAIWFAKQGFEITATDISEKMIIVAKSKQCFQNLNFKQADINTLSSHFNDKKFDLVFSNFGGLNCLLKTELQQFFKNASQLLTDKGQLVLVIMPKNTWWEQFYFLMKGNFKSAFRRKKESALADVDGEKVITYYYNPKDIVNLSDAFFETKSIKPIGFFVPPSYLEPFFSNKPRLLAILKKMDNGIRNWSLTSKYADHYLIAMQKK